jgi:hypothetical protein
MEGSSSVWSWLPVGISPCRRLLKRLTVLRDIVRTSHVLDRPSEVYYSDSIQSSMQFKGIWLPGYAIMHRTTRRMGNTF